MIPSIYLWVWKHKSQCVPLTAFVCIMWKVCLFQLKATEFNNNNKSSREGGDIISKWSSQLKLIAQNTPKNIWINTSSDTGGSHTASSRSTAEARITFHLAFYERYIILGKLLYFIVYAALTITTSMPMLSNERLHQVQRFFRTDKWTSCKSSLTEMSKFH